MHYEIILENKMDNYYFKSKIYKKKGKKPSDFINDYKNGINIKNTNKIQEVSGIFSDPGNFENYIKTLIPGSFGLWYKFGLESPYFSSDDDEFYIISNPILKEQISKIPMIKGSSWKGLLSSVALNKLRKEVESKNIKDAIKYYSSFVRVFGTGSGNFRKVNKEIEKVIEKNNDDKELTKELIKYCLFDLGININIKKDGTSIVKQLIAQIAEIQNKGKVKKIFSVRKGRAIFYPTYFDKLNYEIINPHDRKNRVGKNPIMYEVVSKKTEGIFQLIYIPYDGILMKKDNLEKEIKADKEFIKEILKEALENTGIGAKTKLGWGRAKVNCDQIECYESNLGGE